MPSRKSIVRYDTDSVQGEGSWVRLRKLTVKETVDIMDRSESDMTPVESYRVGLKVYLDHVVEWNWVDDDGNPFPQPSEKPDIVDELTNEEVLVLARLLSGEEDAKN